MKLLFLISNYITEEFLDRKEMLKSIVDSIDENDHHYMVFDDGSTVDLNDILNENKIIQFEHRGKREYYKTWQDMFTHIKYRDKYDGYVFIPNDFTEIDFNRITKYLSDFNGRPFAFNLVNDGRTKMWVNKPLTKINNDLSLVGFTDCGFFTNYETIRMLNFQIDKINPRRFEDPNMSSGVGQQLSNRLDKLKIPIYLPTYSICKHGDHKSSMHPNERISNPLISKHQHKIVVGIATMNSRKNSLNKVIDCLNKQTVKPDKICIYNNDENEFNATDNGKFYYFTTEESKNEDVIFLSMDDDIYYPQNYVETMVEAVIKHQTIVTHHGRLLSGLDRNYYRGHTQFRCLDVNPYEREIDIAGTGVTAFHTSYFKPSNVFHSEFKRMSDCIFSLEAAKQNKKIIVLKHPYDYFKDICDDVLNSCFFNELNKCDKQNEIANEIYKIKKKMI